jgi:arginyl-tRNA synthetase
MCPTYDGLGFVSEASWNAAFYGTMAAASAAAETVQKKAKEIAFPLQLWNVMRKMRDLADLIENPPRVEVATAEQVDPHKVVEQLGTLIEMADNFYQDCRRYGYTNRTLTAAQLRGILAHTETLRDFHDRLKLILDPRTDETFRKAREERARRETVPMSSVF